MSLPYFPMFPKDFEAKTSHLSLEEDGAYNRLLRIMWMSPGCTIPNDGVWIARRMRVNEEQYDRVVKVVIDEFFTVKAGRLAQNNLLQIFEETSVAHLKRVDAGSRGGKAKALKVNKKTPSKAKAMLKQPEPEPEPYKKKRDSLSLLDKSNAKSKNNYSEDFEGFWVAFPETQGTSKKAAFAQWKKLSSDDRKKARGTIPAYIEHLKIEEHRAHHAERYFSKRIFETMAATESGKYAGMTVQEILRSEV